MMKQTRIIVYICIVILLCTASFPQSADISDISPRKIPPRSDRFITFDHITTEQGLSQSTILCIFQDSKGFMWFGSYDGLNRYDGYDIKIYMASTGDNKGLSHNVVTTVYEEITGTGRYLWIGTENGLDCLDLEKETFSHYLAAPGTPGALKNDRIKSLFIDSRGTTWIGTDGGGLHWYDRKAKKFDGYLHDPGNPKSISNDHIRCFYETPGPGGNVLWIGTDRGFNRFDPDRGIFERFVHEPGNPNSLSADNVTTMTGDSSGNLWIGTWLGGLNKYDPRTRQFTRYIHDPSDRFSIGHNIIRSIYEDRSGNLWVGTFGGGLARLDHSTGRFFHYRNRTTDPGSIGSDRIWSIFEDRAGVLWIGTDFGGISKLNPQKRQFSLYKVNTGMPGGLSNTNITAIYEPANAVGKYLWIGTMGGGLKKYDRETGIYTHYLHDPKNPKSLSNNTVRGVIPDPAQPRAVLWVGTDSGLNRFHIPGGTFRHYKKNLIKKKKGLSHDNVYSLCRDSEGNLWLGTYYGGLNRFDPKTEEFTRFRHRPGNPNSLNDHIVWCVLEDKDRNLWIGTDRGGLNRYHRETGAFSHYTTGSQNADGLSSNKVLCLYQDTDGILWLGTTNGLNRFHYPSRSQQARFTAYGSRDLLPDTNIHSILEDNDRNLWLGTLKGLLKFNRDDFSFKVYNTSDGLQGSEFNINACFKSSSGELFFGGTRGLNAFIGSNISGNKHIPPIVITGFQVFNKPVLVGPLPSGRVILEKSVSCANKIELLYEENVFSLQFAALDYAAPEENRYAYIMEGFEEKWNVVDNRRFATYTNLPPGEFTFRVKGANNDGVWNEQGVALEIKIIPPFHKTWWFYALIGFGALVLVFLIEQFVVKYLLFSSFWKKEKNIGQYRLMEKIGGGGMGTVYKARLIRNKSSRFAIKILKEELFAEPRSIRRFKQEAAIVDQLDHPHVLRIIERGQHNQRLYIVMELLDGQTLEEKIKKDFPLPLDESLNIMIQITDALDWIHLQNIIHRDLKAANIMLIHHDNNPHYVKILDFGLARTKFQARLTETGVLVGTVGNLAPEQISRAEFIPAGDIHSLGNMFYKILTGKDPFTGNTATEIMGRILEELPRNPAAFRRVIPPKLDRLVMDMLAKDPAQRPTAGQVLEVLKIIYNTI